MPHALPDLPPGPYPTIRVAFAFSKKIEGDSARRVPMQKTGGELQANLGNLSTFHSFGVKSTSPDDPQNDNFFKFAMTVLFLYSASNF